MPPVRTQTNGIKYSMYQRGEHWRPHVHLAYAEFTAAIALDSLDILHSNLPPQKLREALRWVGSHQQELLQMWDRRMKPGGIYTIPED